jgi:hypothetical protein
MPSDGPFIQTNPSRNDTIAGSLRFEMENRSVNLSCRGSI